MDSILYIIIAMLYVLLFVWGIVLWKQDNSPGLQYLLLIVTAALVWDNGIMGIGKWVGEGELLEKLNLVRFWLHAFCTPLLTIVSLGLIQRSGSRWAHKRVARWGTWIFTAALIVLEVATETVSLTLKPILEYGALRYVPAEESSGPPLMVILILIPLFTAGIILWKRKVTSVLFSGTLIMTIGSAVPIPVQSSAATNIFEIVLITSLWLSIRKLAHIRLTHKIQHDPIKSP